MMPSFHSPRIQTQHHPSLWLEQYRGTAKSTKIMHANSIAQRSPHQCSFPSSLDLTCTFISGEYTACSRTSQLVGRCAQRYRVRSPRFVALIPHVLTISSAYKSSASDSLLAERSRIDSSHQMTDDILEYAAAASSSQHAIFNLLTDKHTRQGPSFLAKVAHWRVSTRVWQASSVRNSPYILLLFSFYVDTIPGINNILAMIKTRRRRDAIIVGTVIAICLLSLLSYMSR